MKINVKKTITLTSKEVSKILIDHFKSKGHKVNHINYVIETIYDNDNEFGTEKLTKVLLSVKPN